MKHFLGLPIATKLIAIIMAAVGLALALAGTAFIVHEMSSYRRSAEAETQTIAQLVAESTTAALAFHDARTAGETLAILRGEPEILAAAIFTRTGKVLAQYSREGSGASPASRAEPQGSRIEQERLSLFHDIRLDGEPLGTLYLLRDLRGFQARLARYLWIAFSVMGASALATLLVSSRLQRLITRPILALADTAGRVTSGNHYEIRAERLSHDEIGLLTDRFNEMMERIQARDRALQRAQDELEARVAQRTAELERQISERMAIEQDLIAAKQMAEDSNRAKSAFLANMSHELRTPLNAVIGYAEMLEEDAQARSDSTAVADLGRIGTAARHLLALINDVLDLSKIEAGRMDLRPEWISVDEVVYEAITAVGPLAAKNGNTLRVEREWNGQAFWADGVRFRQSLVNLLSNACKFAGGGADHSRNRRGNPRRKPMAAVEGARHRDRNQRRKSGQAVPVLLPGGLHGHSEIRRNRPGPGDQPAFVPDDGRLDHSGERRGEGVDVHDLFAPEGGGGLKCPESCW